MRIPRVDGVKIKSPSKIEAMKKAGHLSARALEVAASCIAPGVSTVQIDAQVEEFIRANGGIPAFKGYGGYPATICASVNEMVVHGIPNCGTILREGDIISIDTGAVVDGWVGDNAATFAVGEVSDEVESLLAVTERSLEAGIAQAVAGNYLGDIGRAVQDVAAEAGFSVVRDYCGHGIGRKMHEPPQVFNFGEPHHGLRLEVGMVLAIEPMVNIGTCRVRSLNDGWGVVTADGKASAHFERTVAITEDGPLVLTPWDKKILA